MMDKKKINISDKIILEEIKNIEKQNNKNEM